MNTKSWMWRVGAGAAVMWGALTAGLGPGWMALGQTNETLLWQIGEFDQTSREFGHNFDLESALKPVYTVGKSKPEDWPAWQTTGVVVGGENHAAPYTILFDLPQAPSGVYRLTITVFLVNPWIPDLMVDINGHRGRYFFERKLSYYPGDERIDSPIYGGDKVEIELPARFLRQGENKLVLTVVESNDNTGARSSLIYDALKLTQGPERNLEPTAAVKPSVFFRERDGKTYEVTRVTVTAAEQLQNGSVELAIGGKKFEAPLNSANEFGQKTVDFDVPEFSGATTADVTIHSQGKAYRSSATITPERKWTIYFVPHAHLDIGYTDYQAKVLELQNRNIDKLLEFIPNNPTMRFSLDGSWVVQNYFATRNEAARDRLLKAIRDGKITVPAQYSNLLTGYTSLEELIRSLSYAHELHRTQSVPFDYANITDVPSITWSYPSILNAAGIKYFAEATNSDRGPIVLYGRWNEKSPFWRQGPDGGKVLMANTRQYSQLWFVCELPPTVGNCRQGLPGYLQQFSAPDYKPDAVLMFGSQLENTDVRLSEPDFIAKWSAIYAYPKFILSSFPDYFRYIEQKYGAELPTVTGDGGPYWEDGAGADAKNTAIDRNNQTRAVTAEELATVSRFVNPTLAVPRQQLNRIWTSLMLYAEHTWDSWDSVYRPDSEESVGQLATKDHYVAESQQAASALARQSLSQIADQVHMPAGSLLIFNTLSWSRNGLVELDLDKDRIVVEQPGRTAVPFEVLREGQGYRHVRFLAQDVPAMGFKCYSLEKRKEQEGGVPTQTNLTDTVENSFYRVQVDAATGAVKSIFDKQLNRELVDTASPYRFNQAVYVQGGGGTQIVYMRKSLPFAELKVSPAGDGRIVGVRKTPFGQILEVESKGVHVPSLRTEILLYDTEKKIEFVNHATKEPVREKEALYFAYPVASEKPAFSYEIQNGWVDPSKDMVKGAGLEWFTVGHWVKSSSTNAEVAIVPVDAPMVTLGDINRGRWPETFEPKSSTIFSYAMNNYWHTNYRAEQDGESTFRYVMTSGARLAPDTLSRVGREAMTPLEVDQVIDQDKVGNPRRPLEPVAQSFLQVDAENVTVEAWKAADDGNGTVIRLLETGGKPAAAKLHFPLMRIRQAWVCNAMEVNQQEISGDGSTVEVVLRPHEIVTVRIVGEFRGLNRSR